MTFIPAPELKNIAERQARLTRMKRIATGLLAALGLLGLVPSVWPICLIWVAHIAMDRALGLGLKFPSAFHDTHLGRVGRAAPTA